MKKQNTLSFLFVPKFCDYTKKEEVKQLLNRNTDDLNPFLQKSKGIAYLADRILKPSDTLILIHLDELLIGVSILKLDSLISGFEHVESSLLIQTSVLDPVFRGKGIGTLLYREIEDVNVEILKRPFIFRGTWETNVAQHHLYSKLGYTALSISTYKENNNVKLSLYGKEVFLQEQTPENIIC